MRKVSFLKDWFFCKESETQCQPVTVPHDWAISGPFDRNNDLQITHIVQNGEAIDHEHSGRTGALPHVGKAKYHCTIPGPSASGKRTLLLFDGVMSHAKVYINGELAGSCNYGYTSFPVDATAFLKDGENSLEVTVENLPCSARWYPGAGIYRPVRRIETDAVCFGLWSNQVQYLPEENALLLKGFVENHTGSAVSGRIVLESDLFERKEFCAQIPVDGLAFEEKLPLLPCERWSVENPKLYDVKISVTCGELSDSETIPYGIREIRFDKDRGFLLNGERVKINGVCMHHDLGPIGAAFHVAAAKRQLLILKEMGCNAIRTSHNPPAPQLLDLCDELGFLVMDEAFDCWHTGKVTNDYHIHFDEDSEKDLSTLVRRDRNHPCVILWSIGNELMEIRDVALRGDLIAKRLKSIIQQHDTSRPVTAGLDACDMAIATGIADQVDIPSWNYRPQSYGEYHRRFPHCPVLASETLSTLSSRGIYYFPAQEYVFGRHPKRKEDGAWQCSSYCLDIPSWSHTPEAEMLGQDEYEFVAGQFIWTGFDYLGEPWPYELYGDSRSSYFGCVDLVGLPKDLFYVMQAQWRKQDAPMIHIIPHHWNWKEGQKLDIHVVSNCEEVELFVNEKSLGKITPFYGSNILAERYRFIWHDVKWEPGTVRAVGYRKDTACTEEVLQTASAPAKLVLETQRKTCAADGEDMIFVTVSVTDKDGNLCVGSRPFVKFSLHGESLKLMAADGGDPTSFEAFPTPECTLFSGQGVVYLQSTGNAGETVLCAESDGLESAEIKLNTIKNRKELV